MKKQIRKITAAVMAAAIVFCCSALPAGADDVQDTPDEIDTAAESGLCRESIQTDTSAEDPSDAEGDDIKTASEQIDDSTASVSDNEEEADGEMPVYDEGAETDPGGPDVLYTDGPSEELQTEAEECSAVIEDDGNQSVYSVEFSGYMPASGNTVQAAVWSGNGGQDDLKWYPMTRSEQTGSYTADVRISDHKSDAGIYCVHIYERGSVTKCIKATDFTVTKPAAESVFISEKDDVNGKAVINISGIYADSDIAEIRLAAWSRSGQKDLKWYSSGDIEGSHEIDSFSFDFDIADHNNNQGTYTFHVYVRTVNGVTAFAGGTSQKIAKSNFRKTEVQSVYEDQKVIVTVPNDTAGNADSVRAAFWSDKKGSDDLIWKDLKYSEQLRAYRGEIVYSDLKDQGKGTVHIYSFRKNVPSFLERASFEIKIDPGMKPFRAEQVAAEADDSSGSFYINVTGAYAQRGIKDVRAAVWSDEKGQDDLKWYSMSSAGDGEWKVSGRISDHNSVSGKYNVHVYIEDTAGNAGFAGGDKMTFKTKKGKLTVSDLHEGQYGKEETAYKAEVLSSCIPGGIKNLSAAVWSDENGQDDLRWYQMKSAAGGASSADIDIRNHSGTGKYIIHVYADTFAGKKTFINGTEIYINKAVGKAVIYDRGDSSLSVDLTDIHSVSGVSKVEAAVWSGKDGSDDLRWYTLSADKSGEYHTYAALTDHKMDEGQYNTHIYITAGNGLKYFISAASCTARPAQNTFYVSGGKNDMTRNAALYNSSVKEVRFGVWSENKGQDDVKWYKAKKSGNIFTAALDMGGHSDSGKYNIHAYTNDGEYLAGMSFEWNASVVIAEADAVLNSVGRNLRSAFDWSKTITYDINTVTLSQIPAGTSHLEFFARMGFERHYGNCYVMAACFTQMALILGYDAHLIEGQVPYRNGGFGPHGWCEIDINGTTYVFDPDFEFSRNQNGYMFAYGTSGTWRYTNSARVN